MTSSLCTVVQFTKCRSITTPLTYPVYCITSLFKTRLEKPLTRMRITNAPVVANLHDNSGVGTFLHGIAQVGAGGLSVPAVRATSVHNSSSSSFVLHEQQERHPHRWSLCMTSSTVCGSGICHANSTTQRRLGLVFGMTNKGKGGLCTLIRARSAGPRPKGAAGAGKGAEGGAGEGVDTETADTARKNCFTVNSYT